jgi:hypothetical protein
MERIIEEAPAVVIPIFFEERSRRKLQFLCASVAL